MRTLVQLESAYHVGSTNRTQEAEMQARNGWLVNLA
jgi:hypothetical protein